MLGLLALGDPGGLAFTRIPQPGTEADLSYPIAALKKCET
jgi:hypothetical protein